MTTSVALSVDVVGRINAAFHQNRIPVVGSIELRNDTDHDIECVSIEVTSTPPFLVPHRFTFDRIKAGGVQQLSPVPVELDPKVVLTQSERVRGNIVAVARTGSDEIARCERDCELLSPAEWTGIRSAPELVAAFVRPNDPVVEVILRKAIAKLEKAGRAAGLNGYAEGRKGRAWEIAEAIWAALCDEAIGYVLPPSSFEVDGQKVRSPSAILERKVGTCLDLSLLLAACFEQAGLNPLVVFSEGHAVVGLWLIPHEFAHAAIDEPQVLRKRRDLDDLILIESTLLTSRQRFTFAVEQGRRLVDEEPSKPFELAVDVKRARMRQIKPLALGDDAKGPFAVSVDVSSPIEMPLSQPPVLTDDTRIEESGTTPVGRLEQWKRRLLDLSRRNKLLNFKVGKGSVRLVSPDPGQLEDQLAAGKKLNVLAKPDVMEGADPRSADLQRRVGGADAANTYALEALSRGDVHADIGPDDLTDRLTELFRAARTAMEEGGANSLHLALGFVVWTATDQKGAKYRAPLILLPVSLERRSVKSGFKLVRHDDDARINPTLLEMLRQDFDLTIPEFDRPDLPTDASGLDVKRIWTIARQHLVDAKGFEVTEEVVLSTFSFAKFLMWKDLVDRTEALKQNPVVRHLIDTPTVTYGDGSGLPQERDLDRELRSADLFTPLPADSSQIAAVAAASRGRDFVLFGPPGTGKSQTIANMIVHLLGSGKTVLFVSQKTTALQVVRQRLDRLGLGTFCLEVHSAKAQNSAVLGQLQQAWDARAEEMAAAWEAKTSELDALRLRLNGLVDALHRRRRNGMTAHMAMGRVIAGRSRFPDLRLTFPTADHHDEGDLRRLREMCARLRLALENVGDPSSHPLRQVRTSDWSPAWRTSFLAQCDAYISDASAMRSAIQQVASQLAVRPPGDPQGCLALIRLAAQALKPEAARARHLMAADLEECGRRLANWRSDCARVDQALHRVERSYRDGVFLLDLGLLLGEWRAADASNFFVRGGRKKKVWQALEAFTDGQQPADPGKEIAALMDVASARADAQRHEAPMAVFGPLWQGVQTDANELQASMDWVKATHAAASTCAGPGESERPWLDALTTALARPHRDLEAGGAFHTATVGAFEAYKAFDAAWRALAEAASTDQLLGIESGPAYFDQSINAVGLWQAAGHRTQAWCAWRKVADEASSAGLSPLMDALERGHLAYGDVSDAFELAYARWWIDKVVDGEPALREFIASFHEDAIASFIRLDEEVADLSRHVVTVRLSRKVPPRSAFGIDPEWGALARELTKRARHMPLRQLFGQLPNALNTLAPCMMMSPLSIAQFLPVDAKPFDVVVFDEASQMPVWDAVGAIARGRQMIVVGDPKQLPPTTFFDRAAGDTDDAEIEDLESILDECLAANIPHKRLSWHYRSRHESLIAFSNERYYDGQLVTFPSPVTEDRAVRFVHVPGGVYERGSGRVNKAEAHATVADVLRRLKDPTFVVEKSSIGIVTFNSEQQRLIENLLDAERRRHPEIEPFFSSDWHEPVFVKNLESVQGDERDVILFSVAYGPDAAGHITQNYGPLNLDGGARRLNVAITRARTELCVFATLRPEQIDLSRAKGAGVRDFKHFLDFAERGPRALAEAASPTGREADSPFETAVRDALDARGWTVHLQVGVSGFRIDLAIVHPDAPGRYLAAVECDGATYHRSATARDRDRLREAVLRNLGWRVHRVWSTDWWVDAANATEILHQRLGADLDASRTAVLPDKNADIGDAADRPREAVEEETADVAGPPDSMATIHAVEEAAHAPDEPVRRYADAPSNISPAPVDARPTRYSAADLTTAGYPADREGFYDPTYRGHLRRMTAFVIETEGPINDELLVRRVARHHGFGRAGAQVRDIVLQAVEHRFPRSTEGERTIFWPAGSDKTIAVCRVGADEARDHSEIPDVELAALARRHLLNGATTTEAALLMARDLEIGRLRQGTRERLEGIATKAASNGDST